MFLLYIRTGLCFLFLHKRVAYEKNIYHEMCAKYFVTMAARSVKIFGCTQRENFWQNEVVLKKYENIAIAATCENTFFLYHP